MSQQPEDDFPSAMRRVGDALGPRPKGRPALTWPEVAVTLILVAGICFIVWVVAS